VSTFDLIARRHMAFLNLCFLLAACVVQPPEELPRVYTKSPPIEETLESVSTLTKTSTVAIENVAGSKCLQEIERRELRESFQISGYPKSYTLSSEEFADYLNLMGIDSLCIPVEFGSPFLNIDWNELDDPPIAIGRMVSIGFEDISGYTGWGRGYLVYSTYDFAVGSEYDVFASQEDLEAVRSQSIPNMIHNGDVAGFIRFHASLPMGMQWVSKAYIFPFETYYVAAVLTMDAYDPDDVDEIILEMEEGRHPDLAQESVSLMDTLVASIRFR
jgi:hypothetical protein